MENKVYMYKYEKTPEGYNFLTTDLFPWDLSPSFTAHIRDAIKSGGLMGVAFTSDKCQSSDIGFVSGQYQVKEVPNSNATHFVNVLPLSNVESTVMFTDLYAGSTLYDINEVNINANALYFNIASEDDVSNIRENGCSKELLNKLLKLKLILTEES